MESDMLNSKAKKLNKYEENLKQFIEFKGLSSLSGYNEIPVKKIKTPKKNISNIEDQDNQCKQDNLNNDGNEEITTEVLVEKTKKSKTITKNKQHSDTVTEVSIENVKHTENNTMKDSTQDDFIIDSSKNSNENQATTLMDQSKKSKKLQNKRREETIAGVPNKKIKKDNLKTNLENLEDNMITNDAVKISKEKDTSQSHVKRNYILVENINANVTTDSMKNYLSENGISFDKVLVLPGSLGLASFNRFKEMEKLFNTCQGLQYKTNELFIFKTVVENVDEHCVSNLCETSVHVKNLDISLNDEGISSLLPDLTIENISMNSEKGTAIIDFSDTLSARKCIELLDNKIFGEKTIQASFLLKTQRPNVFTLKVSNVPKNATKSDIRAAFPVAMKINMKKDTNRCLIHFKDSDDLNSVLNSDTAVVVKGNQLTVEQLISHKSKKHESKIQYVLNIFNLPFDTTVQEIKDQYNNVRFVEMLKNPEGKFMGSAKLMFNEKQCCEEALKTSKGLTFKHRKVRAEMKIDEGDSWRKADNSEKMSDGDC